MKVAAALMFLVAVVGLGICQNEFSIEDFTRSPSEHVINRIEAPFVVRSIRGLTTSTGVREPFPGVLFELQGPVPNRAIRKAIADRNGRFTIKHVQPGTYHFKATADGWQSVIGTITVSDKADKRNEIRLDMRLGV
ncbi:MAG: carboxypeptidase-like regulatory domain-containing protein [Acidobacteriia bacterium]|nr:carboxypeptidase-like regulatory domain-containing protein [Terriglobia bacterium]